MPSRFTSLVAIAALARGAVPAAAQAVEGRLLLSGGTATDTRGVRSGAWNLSPALLVRGSRVHAQLLGRYGRFDDEGWTAGGGAAAAAVVPLWRALSLQLEGAGDYTRNSYRDQVLSASAAPALRTDLGRVALTAGATGAWGRLSYEQDLPGGILRPPGAARAAIERSGAGPVLGAELHLFDLPHGGLMRLAARTERITVGGDRYTDRLLRVTGAVGPVTLAGTLGDRRAPDHDHAWGGVRAAVSLGPSVSLLATAERYPANPVTGTLAGRTIGAGLMLRLGATRTAPSSFPRPANVPPPGPGLTRVSLRAERALAVEVAGDWNDWRPMPLTRTGNGVWYADLPLSPGTYRYAFRVDGAVWTVPRGIKSVDDGYGGRAAWLTVAPAEARSTSSNPQPEDR